MSKVWKTALFFVLVSSILVTAAGPKSGPDIIRLTGPIESIDTDNLKISVKGTTIQVTAETVITRTFKKVQEEIGFGYLAVDMTVQACGQMDNDVLVAHKINVKCICR